MIQKSFYINCAKDIRIHVIKWSNENTTPIGIIHILHGMAEHCARYSDFAKFLVSKGYTVYAHDHRKHGKSICHGQEVGLFDEQDTFWNILRDVKKVQNYIKKNEKEKDIILLGHSMGSLICRRYLQEYGYMVSKAIIMGTMCLKPIPLYGGIIAGKLNRVFSPNNVRSDWLNNLAIGGFNKQFEPGRTAFDWLTRDEDIVNLYIEDPLCGYSYSATFYIYLFKEIIFSQKRANILRTPNIPLLFISGMSDPVGFNGDGVKSLMHLYRSNGYRPFMKQTLLKECRHEILNELNRVEVYQMIMDWINSH